MELKPEQIEILKFKYLDHTEDLRFRTTYDFKVLSGFITLNLALAAWMAKYPLTLVYHKIVFASLIAGLCIITIILFQRNFRRRRIVIKIIQNINEAFRFDEKGVYKECGPINPPENQVTTYWIPWYICIVVLFLLCQLFIIFAKSELMTSS